MLPVIVVKAVTVIAMLQSYFVLMKTRNSTK